ncbi:MAG: SUF system Fe-S cluster assembly regulator [Pelagibacterales bacterium]|nr:SUF system Fe-S cluster assembly regulator [Pelagibacterales bacterium]OUV25932.1 MAG: SUF system Fe-S cluster assembly regulator [Alphaproteobacteria bacterium TMED109]RCL82674.1 MAG: SUF system Fe-S cluster assembly regulator [Alphaproteobacteria bacterium]|tara:strand:- start:2754 stop:3224 length:471 start_codon:yes stop_codon:yes gene_type:complete
MIKVSRMADYAILLVCKMSNDENKVYSSQELSIVTSLKITTISKILTKLTKANVTDSIRGVSGGYKLTMQAEDISVGNIIDIIDGKVALTICVEEGENHNCNLVSLCPSQSNWQIINNTVREALNSVSIAEMANPFVSNFQYKEGVKNDQFNKVME